MDTEQVISNPYQDLQSEAVDGGKKTSLTERLASVRNNVCEHNLRTATSHLEKERTHSLRNIHMDASSLRYQVKVMDLNKRKYELDMQKRMRPRKDFSYDNRQIANSAKRLGISSENSFYLDKKLSFPLRGNIVKDHDQKPIIKKARRTLVVNSIRKKHEKTERAQTARTYDRATTAHTVSTTVDVSSPEPSTKEPQKSRTIRGGSKSAPPPKISSNEPQRSSSRLSIIDEVDAKLPSIRVSTAGRHTSKSHVKFDVKSNTHSSQDGLYRSKTFYSGMSKPMRPTRSYSEAWDSDSDDDYIYCEKVDLRALFFGDKSQNSETKSTISSVTTPHTRLSSENLPLRRCSTAKTPKVTEEMMIKEQNEIKTKVNKFLGTMKEDKVEAKKELPKPVEEKKVEKDINMMSKAAVLLSVFSKPIDHSKTWGFVPPKKAVEVKIVEKSPEDEKPKTPNTGEDNKSKKLWELIRTNVQSGNIKRKYTANDLLLQQLTGILVQADKKPKVPIHAASRALRHTPTFKMRRVVEELMRQRTRYEQQEVEKLQKAESLGEGGMYPNGDESGVQHYPAPARAWATPTKELEQVA